MDAVWTPGIGEGEAATDFVLDAPSANIATTTTTVVHLCCLEEGVGVCWDEVEGEGVWEACSRSVVLVSIYPLKKEGEAGLTMDTSTKVRNISAIRAQYD